MKLFDKINRDEETEEVAIRPSESEESGDNRLEQEAEARLTGTEKESSSDSSSSSGTGSFLPGMDADTSTAGTSKTVTQEDIHEQNEKIIELLEDIKSEMRGY